MGKKSETIPIDNVPLQEQHDIVIQHLGYECEVWLPAKARAERDGHWNAELNAVEDKAMERIDKLLDALSDIVVAQSLEYQP